MNRLRMVAAAAAALVAGCSRAPRRGGTRVGLVSDFGGIGDHSFNDSAYAGLMLAKRRLGVSPVVLQSRSVADYQPNFMALANERIDEIFAIGYDEALDLGSVAGLFPHQHFSIVDAEVDAPNVTSVRFREQEGSFLAGALAALTTRTKTIGFLGGADVPIIQAFEAGYCAGAREIDPAVRVLVKYVGSFDDVAAGKELTGLMFGAHADIVYTAAGKAGLGAIGELHGRDGVYVIGVDSDQDALVPGKILTSVLKRIDVSVFELCAMAAAHRPRPPKLVLGLREGAVGLTDFRYTRRIVGAATIERLDRITAAIVRGELVAPTTREALASFRRVAL